MIEGMWAFVSGSAAAPDDMRDGGIVVLETGRVFGGDSAMAYVGNYELKNGLIEARVRSWTWNSHHVEAGAENVFGMKGAIDFIVILEGKLDGDVILGSVYPEGVPEMKVSAFLKKITDLP